MTARLISRARPFVVVPLCVIVLMALSGCDATDTLSGNGIQFQVPPDWQPVAPTTWVVPGTPLAAWKGPNGWPMVVYRSLGLPGLTAEEVLANLANRYDNLPETKVVARTVLTVGRRPAARLDVVAAGDGATLAPTGLGKPYVPPGGKLVPTRRVIVAVPGPRDTISILWHAPESEAAALRSQIDSLLSTLTISAGSQPAAAY